MRPEETNPDPVVCIVDDDESVRRALSRLIDSLGMRVETFASANEFLDRTAVDPICCMLLDIRLPGINGFDLHERLAEAGFDLPVIFITGHPDDLNRARAEKAGAVAFLAKPFDDQTLLNALEAALDRVSAG